MLKSKKQRTKHESRIEELNNEKNQLSDQLRTAADLITTLQAKVDSLEQSMNVLQQNHAENLEKNRKEFSECHERELAAVREQRHLKEDDFRSAMDKVHVLTEEKAVTDSELANLQEMLEQKQSELASLRVSEANTTALYNEALNKVMARNSWKYQPLNQLAI